MATKTGISTVPTKPQANLLIAALGAENHRVPSTATGRTLDIMLRRQWVKEYTANGRLASTVRDYPGFTHFRLTHHGVNAANKAKAQKQAPAEEHPADQRGLAAAEWDLHTARQHLQTGPSLIEHTALSRRCAQIRDRIEEILRVVNGEYANLPVQPTYTYREIPTDLPEGHRCCIKCANAKTGLLEVVHTASGQSALVCLAHDDERVREMLRANAAHELVQAVQVAAQDPKVRAAEPGSGGLVYMRRGAVPVAVPDRSASTYGALGATLEVPQVDAAIRILKAGRQVLGGFADTGHCVSAGAYLGARWSTGEVVLSCEPTHVRPAGRVLRELLDEREQSVAGYANLFRTAGWCVQEIREPGQDGTRRLARLILERPLTLPWGSRVLRASDGRLGTITGYSTGHRMIITWDRAIKPDPFHRTIDELTGPAFQVFPAVDHCSGCGEIVNDDEVEDSYTKCCNEGACSGCAAVNGVYTCGTEAPTGTAE
ncbi:hypothetical protein ACFWCA_19085 [Streptomyces phaeochromogenes]|uniref:hypothetical protein n=1 Tax=Streptomyces phaeochromogenes TaxID=1923 RepID=UPI0036868C0C